MPEDTFRFWDGCDLVIRDPEVVSGAPVIRGTRLPADTLIANVESFVELDGLSEEQAIQATYALFPDLPGGSQTLLALIAYQTGLLQAHAC